ncbi:MAG: DNA primase [Planctomycetaceae bacterium]
MQAAGDDFKQLVRSSTNLVDLVSETVTLKPLYGGRSYVGLCPFHEDHNPSFNVYPDRQSYRCWVCDEGGDCFSWVMKIEKVPFPEALESLAKRARLEIPRRGPQSDVPAGPGKGEALEVAEWAANLMHQTLRTSPVAQAAREYVAKRRLTDETVRSFRLGYHPEDRYWLQDKARGRFTTAQLVAAGIIRPRDGAQGYSAMDLADRLVFPVFDEKGRVVAFGGRVLPGRNDQNRGKYWNSWETSIFQKRRTTFAFDKARETIRRQKVAIVVEGYMDCIACHQAGVTGAIATLGTALTEDHVKFLRRFAERVVLVYDSDDAGQRAAEKSISQFLAQDLDLRILNVPSGKDPADYLEDHSREEFLKLTESALEAWDYKLQAVMKRLGTDSISARQQVLTQMLDFLNSAPGLAGTVREDLILRTVCWKVQVDERIARQQLSELRQTARKRLQLKSSAETPEKNVPRSAPGKVSNSPQSPARSTTASSAIRKAERDLLEIILTCPETIDLIRHHIGPDDFSDSRHRQLLELCIDLWKEEGELPETARLISAADSDTSLLSLINAVLDSAEEKGIFRLMAAGRDPAAPTDSSPAYLESVLAPLLEQREQHLRQTSRQLMAQTDKPRNELDEATRNALKKLHQFRQNQMGYPTAPK